MKKFWIFIGALVVSFLPGLFGILFTPMTSSSSVWFNTLSQSVLTPAPIVFTIAWTILYALLGVALFLVLINTTVKHERKVPGYWAFLAQMILNGLWSYVFFGLNSFVWGLVVLVALVGVSIWLAREFWGVNRWAGFLVLIYLAWLLFALYLNTTILFLN